MNEKAGDDFEVVRYLEHPPDRQELSEIIELLGVAPEELVRKSEPIYKELYKDKTMSDKDWIDAMIEHPKLIQRPIVVKDGKAVIGRPPENVLSLL
jgi:arsenate reductase